jgi:large subunit ribosomal protein L33
MAKKNGNRIVITLACVECSEQNYNTEKNRRNTTDRVEFNKFCPRCRVRRLHREIRS